MKRKKIIISLIVLLVLACCLSFALAEEKSPYGTYHKGSADGYGGKKPVTTKEDALKVLKNFFADKGVKIGNIKEKELFFEAEILDKNNNVIDKVIIDKRTGRIRSIY